MEEKHGGKREEHDNNDSNGNDTTDTDERSLARVTQKKGINRFLRAIRSKATLQNLDRPQQQAKERQLIDSLTHTKGKSENCD